LIAPAVALAPALRTRNRPFVIRVREGFRMQIDGSSQTGRMLYATGEYESETTRLIKRLLAPGQTMIDVGANIGYFAIVAARAVGPQGRVVAFEPVGPVRARLQRNLALNGLSRVEVREEALSASSGNVKFFTGPADDTGLASLRPLEGSRETTVRQVRFDDLWRVDDPVALVKIDVEGAEMAAIRGMSGTLRRWLPDIVVEVTDAYLQALGSSAAELMAFLTGIGYKMHRIATAGLERLNDPSELGRCPPQFNALFTTRIAESTWLS